MTQTNGVDRKNTHKIDISAFKVLATDARKHIPKKLVDVCMVISQVTETMVAAGTAINYEIANRMGEEIEKYLCN